MRLREPLRGYKLSSGHFMFHMAYLWGSFIAMKVLSEKDLQDEEAQRILFQLNMAHVLTPISNLCSNLADSRQYFVVSKLCDIFSIF